MSQKKKKLLSPVKTDPCRYCMCRKCVNLQCAQQSCKSCEDNEEKCNRIFCSIIKGVKNENSK